MKKQTFNNFQQFLGCLEGRSTSGWLCFAVVQCLISLTCNPVLWNIICPDECVRRRFRPDPPAPHFVLLLILSRSIRAESNFTPLNVTLNTCTKYPACQTSFMMSHLGSEEKYTLLWTTLNRQVSALNSQMFGCFKANTGVKLSCSAHESCSHPSQRGSGSCNWTLAKRPNKDSHHRSLLGGFQDACC